MAKEAPQETIIPDDLAARLFKVALLQVVGLFSAHKPNNVSNSGICA
jgi:hypothetical protein